MQIIDAHIHLWDLDYLDYPELQESNPVWESLLGDYSSIRRNFLLSDYLAVAKDVVGAVHVQVRQDLAETEWVSGIDFPLAIIAPAVEGHCNFPQMRGIRHILAYDADPAWRLAPSDDLADPAFARELAELSRRDLIFETVFYPHQADAFLALIRDLPLTCVVEHFLFPCRTLEGWEEAMKNLAPHTWFKLTALGTLANHYSDDEVVDLARRVIDIFGPSRTIWGSNVPPDAAHLSYAQVFDLADRATADLSSEERQAIFHDNAHSLYRLDTAV